MPTKKYIFLLILLLLTACGGETASPTAAPEATVTPIVADTAPAPTFTPTVSQTSQLLQRGQTAIDQKDFDSAINALVQANTLEPNNPTVIEALVNAYQLAGEQELSTIDNNPNALRNAIALFHEGEKIAGTNSTLAKQLSTNKQAAQAMFDALDAQAKYAQLKEADGDLAERETVANRINDLADTIEQLRPDFPTLVNLRYQAWLNLADVKEKQGNQAETFAARKEIWQVALDWCNKATQLQLDDLSAAQTCVERLQQKMIPPTPVPTVKPQPTAVPVPPTAPPAPPAPPAPKKLRFWKDGTGDEPTCISMQIFSINPAGWYFNLDATNITGYFDGGGNARACGLGAFQEYTFTVYYANGNRVPGGSGVPTRGGDFMKAEWR